MFKNILWISVMAFAVLFLTTWKDKKDIEQKWKTAVANVKAYDALLGEANNKNAAFQLTINQLKNCNDSVLKELNAVRRELKVKDKDVQALQYVYSTLEKTDTIIMPDTIFVDKTLAMDTVVGDEWYNLRLSLRYPSSIMTKPAFKSEKYIVVHTKKETVNPPKKFWLFRLFQKRHTILKVDVVEKNPYVNNESSRYVEIIR